MVSALLGLLSMAEFLGKHHFDKWKKVIFHGKVGGNSDIESVLLGATSDSAYVLPSVVARLQHSDVEHCMLGVLGLIGEACEVVGVFRQYVMGEIAESVFKQRMIAELGDCLWYVTLICDKALGISVEEVFRANKDKLEKRWPNGFKFESEESK